MSDDVTLTSRGVSLLMKKGDTWFSSARVRRELYAKGFPRPRVRGRWSRAEVEAWINGAVAGQGASLGRTQEGSPPKEDWSRVIAERGAALDDGIDPDRLRAAK